MNFFHLLALVGQASSWSVPQFPEEPPVPLRVPDEKNKLPDTYMVSLKEGYSLDDHFCNIGVDLRTAAPSFFYLKMIHWYCFNMPNSSAMLRKIRYDKGVIVVEQDALIPLDEILNLPK